MTVYSSRPIGQLILYHRVVSSLYILQEKYENHCVYGYFARGIYAPVRIAELHSSCFYSKSAILDKKCLSKLQFLKINIHLGTLYDPAASGFILISNGQRMELRFSWENYQTFFSTYSKLKGVSLVTHDVDDQTRNILESNAFAELDETRKSF